MNTPNDLVRMRIAKDYMADRLAYENNRQALNLLTRTKPGRFHCALCHALVHIGHLFVAFGRRLERFDLVLRQSQI